MYSSLPSGFSVRRLPCRSTKIGVAVPLKHSIATAFRRPRSCPLKIRTSRGAPKPGAGAWAGSSNRMSERQDAAGHAVLRESAVASEVPGRQATFLASTVQQPFSPADLSATYRVDSAGFPSCAPETSGAFPSAGRGVRNGCGTRVPAHVSGDMPVRGPLFRALDPSVTRQGSQRESWIAWKQSSRSRHRPHRLADCTSLA
jgi:hypothetical protein